MKRSIKKLTAITLVLMLIIGVVAPVSAGALTYSGSSSYASGKYYRQLKAVTLTGNQRVDIVNVAKSQIGYQEGSSSSQLSGEVRGRRNCTEYGRWYGLQDMWCAMFVSWCANTAGISSSIVPRHSYTPTGLSWFKNRGQAYSRATVASGGYTPQAGDIIYFKSSRNTNPTNHIGIVTGYSNGTVYTIEGNTSSATISTNGGAVAAKSYSISNTYIVYICKPSYTGSNISASTSTSSSNNSSAAKAMVFDAGYYSAKYADLKNAFGTNATKLYNHYLSYGIKEGRQASPLFNVAYYLNNNADLKAAFGSNYKKAYNHYLTYGINELRKTAAPANLGSDFIAKISFSGKNLSLSGTNVILYHNSTAPAQQWRFIRQSDGSYKIVNQKNSYCLDVANGADKSGANVQIYSDNGSKAQRWFIYERNGKYILKSACTNTCVLDVNGAGTADCTNIQQYTYNASSAQLFSITKVDTTSASTNSNQPANIGTNFTAKISFSGKNLSLNGTNVILFQNSTVPAQQWKFIRQSDGSYKIVNTKNNYCLDVNGGSANSGTNVQISSDNGSKAQRWFIYAKDGKYVLRAACSTNCVLDVAGGASANYTNIQQYTYNGSTAQCFTITKVA